ncbi:M13 family metallopeptidase [Rhodocista pekingensis]|uniref:M13 family metallopeptidase n=1 Tax=Rhodocista pekingensis TaxID=201185 RepID=A0ABW2KTI9_9PROT
MSRNSSKGAPSRRALSTTSLTGAALGGMIGAFALALTVSGAAVAAGPTQVAQSQAVPKAQPPAPGLPVLDPAVSPCQNFFLHACGPWIKAHPIPDDQSRWGSFNLLAEDNQAILHEILEAAVKTPTPDTQKIGDYYKACMDEQGIEAKGLTPLAPVLSSIQGLKDKKAIAPLMADLHRQGIGGLFRFGQQQDFKDATMAIAVVDQGGLGLPDRDFYLKDDERSTKLRDAYVAHVQKMFELAGSKPEEAAKKAAAVMKIETALADGSMTRVMRRQPENRYNMKTFADFTALAPSIDWAAYTSALGVPPQKDLNVANPAFFQKLEEVVKATSLDDLKTYLSWHALRGAAPMLPDAFVQENFNFYGKALSGAKQIRPRWKRCVAATDNALGEDLGQHYVEKVFGPEHKKRMLAMVEDIQSAFHEKMGTLEWMSPETQTKAREKLASVQNKIGYPDQWLDYSLLEVKPDDALGNAARANAFETKRDLDKIGKPVDRGEWFMTPPTVNAYYSPAFNDINFPAGILRPPFFDFEADDAYNYGAIGAVIGHEITHGFDDQGRKFDAKGNLSNWWTEDDAKRFTQRAQCLVDQYGSYVAEGEVKQNGELTLGENTADNGGLRLALAGLRKRLGEKGLAEKVGGLTAEQRFFYGWAHVWCATARPEARVLQAKTDPHSLPEYRVNGTVSNMEDFAKAFNCKPTDPMVRGEKACRVW